MFNANNLAARFAQDARLDWTLPKFEREAKVKHLTEQDVDDALFNARMHDVEGTAMAFIGLTAEDYADGIDYARTTDDVFEAAWAEAQAEPLPFAVFSGEVAA